MGSNEIMLREFLRTRVAERTVSFADGELPESPTVSTITLPREQLARFRDEYARLTAFAAYVCGTTVDKLCLQDLIAYLGEELKKQGENKA